MEHPAEHLEHLEHQQHAAHDPFDKRVAMTMALVAACLATMTMLGHRAHNETIRHRIEAGDRRTQAGDKRTQAANQWAYYQAKNIRRHSYQQNMVLLDVLPKQPGAQVTAQVEKARADWQKQLDEYKVELPRHMADAQKLDGEAVQLEKDSLESLKLSEHYHHLGTDLDIAELGVELSLVLCSLAVLTKRGAFWYAGILAGSIGVVFGAVRLVLHLAHG